MSIFSRIKSLWGDGGWSELMPGFGTIGSRLSPFNRERSIHHFAHWAYAASMLNANAVANVPLRLYARRRPTKKLFETRPAPKHVRQLLRKDASAIVRRKVSEFADELVEVIEPHPALTTLDTVNEFQNGYELTVLRMLDLQISGNSYLYPVKSGMGVPTEVWRLPPQWMRVRSTPKKLVDGYNFGNDIDPQKYGPDEVIHFKLPNPDTDILYGRGWFEAAWTALGLHNAKRTMDLALFENMARPDYLLIAKGGFKKEALDRFEEKVNKDHRGAGKTGKFITISGDIAVQQLNWKIDEQGTPTRVIEEISAVSGVPIAMLLSNDPNRANSQTARKGWYRNTIRPYCRIDEEKLNEKWLPMFDGSEDLLLVYDPASFEDEAELSKLVIDQVRGGIIAPNEGRLVLGYERHESPEADRLYAPAGSTDAAVTNPQQEQFNGQDTQQSAA